MRVHHLVVAMVVATVELWVDTKAVMLVAKRAEWSEPTKVDQLDYLMVAMMVGLKVHH